MKKIKTQTENWHKDWGKKRMEKEKWVYGRQRGGDEREQGVREDGEEG